MTTSRASKLLTAMTVAVALSPFAAIAADPARAAPADAQVAVAIDAAPAANLSAAAWRGWEDMVSREPFDAMGVGNTHPHTMKRGVAKGPDLQAWQGMFSREPHPGMGVGSGHRMP